MWSDVRRALDICPAGCKWEHDLGEADSELLSCLVDALAGMLGLCLGTTRKDLFIILSIWDEGGVANIYCRFTPR